MKIIGGQDMVSPIKKILVKHPRQAFIDKFKIKKEYAQLNYLGVPDYKKACSDYDKFLLLLKSFDMEVQLLLEDRNTTIDSIYTHDPCIVCDKGIILCNMGKEGRVNEPLALKKYFESINIPILGKIENPGLLEGGDVVWIDKKTLAIGEGYRSNIHGIKQLKSILGELLEELIVVPLPHWNGKSDCLHLLSNLSPIDHNLFLVYPRLLPVSFLQYLIDRGIELIEVPDSEYESMGCNVLTVEPKKVIVVDGNPKTKSRLEKRGVHVFTYDGSEISVKGAGGPTCLTKPFLRATSY